MDMFNKIKARVVEGLESESEDPGGGSLVHDDLNSPSKRSRAELEKEVTELKEHINKNYFIYVKRLEKRKERVKELEEYTKLLIKDNEQLQQEQEKATRQLTESRDQLESLESLQNQELAKVKHMLLSAETALEREREKNRAELKVPDDNDDDDRGVSALDEEKEALKKELEEVKKKLDEKFVPIMTTNSEGQGQSSDSDECEELRRKLSRMTAERDQIKSAMLDMEISHHESRENAGSENERVKLELAKANAAKESLEAALQKRIDEFKTKKDESERESTNLRGEVQSKTARIASLEAEVSSLKNKTAAKNSENEELSKKVEKMSGKLKAAKESSSKSQLELAEFGRRRDEHEFELSVLRDEKHKLQASFDMLNSEHDKVLMELGEVTLERDDLKSEVGRLNVANKGLDEELKRIESELEGERSTFVERVEKSSRVRDLLNRIRSIEDDLDDKRNMIKLHNSRMNEMKKALQRELHNGTSPSSPSPPPAATPTTTAQSLTPSSRAESISPSMSSPENVVTMTDVNFKYLKHVIFKFFTSPDYEARHLTRAISALLRLTSDEERLLQEHLDWKMSWFGSKPKLGSGQFSLSIDGGGN